MGKELTLIQTIDLIVNNKDINCSQKVDLIKCLLNETKK